jgi:acetyl-CoA C-acetyltransferase
MRETVILAACRTPIGKFRGQLSSPSAAQLGAAAIRAALDRAGISPADVDEVIMGNVLSAGVGQAPARQAALSAGIPPTVAALTINKVCGSGLKAVMLADQAVRTADAEVIVAGGMESMSRAPYLLARDGPKTGDRSLVDSMLHDGLVCPFSGQAMGRIAESLARSDGISRAEQDEYASESHRRAATAMETGVFVDEIVPVAGSTHSQTPCVSCDEGPRRETTVEQLAQLRPVFVDDGTITAGNASMISDGAAALVLTSAEFAKQRQLTPLARVIAGVTAGTEPGDLFIAPVPAIHKVLDRAKRSIDAIDLFEINEAFAAQMIACLNRLGLSREIVNVHGGAIALGHPIGASGARVLVTLVNAMRRRSARLGVAALCLGGGNAVALAVEAL